MNKPGLTPIISRHHYGLYLAFALVAVFGGWYFRDTYQTTLSQSQAQEFPARNVFSWGFSGRSYHASFVGIGYQDFQKFHDNAQNFLAFLDGQKSPTFFSAHPNLSIVLYDRGNQQSPRLVMYDTASQEALGYYQEDQ